MFAGLTAMLDKVGVASINSSLATFIRIVVILAVIAAILSFHREWSSVATLDIVGLVFLVLSGIPTGLSWHG